jgi:serine/threonine protein kinase
MTPATFVRRRLGDFRLVAQLSEDALGTVYRALDESDEGRFLRLRVLQSPELSPDEVASAITRHAPRVATLSHQAIVQRERLGFADAVPYLSWHESAGWTLDFVLSRLRAEKKRIPLPYAVFVAQRLAAALEHAWYCVVDGEPTHHGLLWPGFVAISPDAEIRVGGFGLADAVLPALHRPRLARDVAPYVPPEARSTGFSGENADVYSIGAILAEIAAGRRAGANPDLGDLPEDEPLTETLRPVLQRALASPADRFASAAEVNRALQELLAQNRAPISSGEFALFLYELLNPESRSVPTAVDGESTNPVRPGEERADGSAERSRVPTPVRENRMSPSSPTRRLRPDRRRLAFAAILAAAAIVASVTLLRLPGRRDAVSGRASVNRSSLPTAVAALPPPPPALESRPSFESVRPAVRRRVVKPRRPSRVERSSAAPTPAEKRSAADAARLEAGLARVAAERLDAAELASGAFSAARQREQAGEASLKGGDPAAAQSEFGRAAGLFREAEEQARQERVRRVRLTGDTQ